jgi:hypothetical protein
MTNMSRSQFDKLGPVEKAEAVKTHSIIDAPSQPEVREFSREAWNRLSDGAKSVFRSQGAVVSGEGQGEAPAGMKLAEGGVGFVRLPDAD